MRAYVPTTKQSIKPFPQVLPSTQLDMNVLFISKMRER